MIEGVVVHHILDIVRPPHTHPTAWCCLNHPCDSRPKQLVRHSTHACPRCTGNTHYIALRPRATESAFAVSSQFRENTFITHIITEPPTYTRVSSSCLLSTRAFRTKHVCCLIEHASSENCPTGRCLNIITNSTHHPPTYVCNKASQMPSPTAYLVPRYDQYRFITPPLPFKVTVSQTSAHDPPPNDKSS